MNKNSKKLQSILQFAVLALLLAIGASCQNGRSSAQKVEYTKPANLVESVQYIKEHFMKPEDYVIDKFREHDIVILGEFHRLRHDPLLVQELIPLLVKNGIFTLAIEFANFSDQELIDKLITSDNYDEQTARNINFNSLMSIGLGGYQEYCDLFKAAWKVNKSIPGGKQKFRVLGLNNTYDYSIVKTEKDRNNYDIMQKIFQNNSEKNWANRLYEYVLAKNEKALVYCGIHHAFTEYKQPIVDNQKFIGFNNDRFGNYVYEKIGKKAFTIFLHSPWNSAKGHEDNQMVLPADGMIDHLLAALPEGMQEVGFDLRETPMGKFTGEKSIYKYGYDNFRLEMYCDGYICQGKFTDYKPVTAISNFINASNIKYAQAHFLNPSFRMAPVILFNYALKDDTNSFKKLFRTGLESAKEIYQAK